MPIFDGKSDPTAGESDFKTGMVTVILTFPFVAVAIDNLASDSFSGYQMTLIGLFVAAPLFLTGCVYLAMAAWQFERDRRSRTRNPSDHGR
jgi:hypothetical protein